MLTTTQIMEALRTLTLIVEETGLPLDDLKVMTNDKHTAFEVRLKPKVFIHSQWDLRFGNAGYIEIIQMTDRDTGLLIETVVPASYDVFVKMLTQALDQVRGPEFKSWASYYHKQV